MSRGAHLKTAAQEIQHLRNCVKRGLPSFTISDLFGLAKEPP